MAELKILCDTILKQKPVVAAQLPDNQKQSIKAGTVLELSSYTTESDHLKVTFKSQAFQGQKTWYVFQKHGAITQGGFTIFPKSVKLTVPYYDQLDNSENPYGTCNVTSMSMCLAYLGARRQEPNIRFPDELSQYCDTHGLDRHEPKDLVKVVEAYGCKDNFTTKATLEDVKGWLIQGYPCVTHGYFTASGHIVTFIGYNDRGLIVNDPYGELMYNPLHSYYNTYASGAGLLYSYTMIRNVCMTGGEFWVHFLSKPPVVNSPVANSPVAKSPAS